MSALAPCSSSTAALVPLHEFNKGRLYVFSECLWHEAAVHPYSMIKDVSFPLDGIVMVNYASIGIAEKYSLILVAFVHVIFTKKQYPGCLSWKSCSQNNRQLCVSRWRDRKQRLEERRIV